MSYGNPKTCASLFTENKPLLHAVVETKVESLEDPIVAALLAEEGRNFGAYIQNELKNQHFWKRQTDRVDIEAKPFDKKTFTFKYRESRFAEALKHYSVDLKILRDRILDLELNTYAPIDVKKQLQMEREFDNALLRMSEENSGIIARTSEYLSVLGVNHSVIKNFTPLTNKHKDGILHIEISTKGDHQINQIAKELKAKYKFALKFDTAELLRSNSEGFFQMHEKTPNVVIDPSIILNKNRFQNSTFLHEFRHAINAWLRTQDNIKPYHGKIEILFAPRLKEGLRNYGEYFSIDEISAFRVSMRTMAHHAVTLKEIDPGTASDMYTGIQREAELLVNMSDLGAKVFKQLQMKGSGTVVSTIDGKFRVDIPPGADLKKTAEMLEFTHMLYKLIGSKLSVNENYSEAKKTQTLKQVIKVLTLPSVRKLEGNYPSRDEIVRLLNE